MRVSPPLPSPCPPAWRKNRRKSPATAPERVGQRFASGSASLPTNGDDAEHERQKAAQHVHEFAVYYKALVSECCESMDTFPDETMEWLQSEEGQHASKEQYEQKLASLIHEQSERAIERIKHQKEGAHY